MKKLEKKLKKIEACFDDYQSIVKGGRNCLFKGHSFDVSFCNGIETDKGIINVTNAYYSGFVHQEYNIDKHMTNTTYHKRGNTPKWLREKLTILGKEVCPNTTKVSTGGPWNTWFIDIDANPKIVIYGNEYTIMYKTSKNEVKFNNHFDNINELKKLGELYKTLREKLKYSNVDIIKKYLNGYPDSFMLNMSKNFII